MHMADCNFNFKLVLVISAQYLCQMSEYTLYCNYKKCRKPIKSFAWITSCSHVFCEEHAHQEPEHDRKCVACENPLKSKYDLVRADLNPPEEFKSMVLAGLRPEVIMDIATRGITFWCHQMFQEKLIQLAKGQMAESHLNNMESSYETLIAKMKNDFQAQNKNYDTLKTLSDGQARRIQELEESLNKKNQQLRSLQIKLEIIKRENLSASLSQGIVQHDYHPNAANANKLQTFIDQQSMVHCPFSLSQQPVTQKHDHHRHHHMHHQNHRNESTTGGNIFKFKPNSSVDQPSLPTCKNRFNLPFDKG